MLVTELAKDKKRASEVALRKFAAAKANLGQELNEKIVVMIILFLLWNIYQLSPLVLL